MIELIAVVVLIAVVAFYLLTAEFRSRRERNFGWSTRTMWIGEYDDRSGPLAYNYGFYGFEHK